MDNFTRAVRFERPDYIPMAFAIPSACYYHYPKEAIWDLMESHPFLFPNFKRPADPDWMPRESPITSKDKPYTDVMGCTWETAYDGIVGTVTGHPLADWDAFGTTWKMPDPNTTDGLFERDWEAEKRRWAQLKSEGKSFDASLRHGHTFLQLCDLRGYDNFMFDMVDEEPRLMELIEQLEDFNAHIVRHFVEGGCRTMQYPDDLGMQVGPMIPPDLFKRYIKPSYTRLMKIARDAGIPIHMHSDGDIRTLVDDLVESGVEVINLQDLVNGIDWIAQRFKGKLCVQLDVDRQLITPYGTPEQIDQLIREEVTKLSTPQGGLCMIYGWYPGVPLENAKAVMDAMEKYAFYYD